MTNKVYVVATIIAKDGKQDDLKAALQGLVPVAKTEAGYIQYDLHQSIERPTQFVFYEIWENERLLDEHNNTDFMKKFGETAGKWIDSVQIDKFDLVS
ncbi:antibiotic biosynthesis monooxygenase [Brucella sp. 21LCYQ03]|nr:antibiotic biosynthesis monooxygenase [Brucella sp. 21LCYQ03]